MAEEERSEAGAQPTKGELTKPEMDRLLPPAVDFLTQAGWDQVDKMLAIALATHQVINANTEEIRRLALALLQAKQQKEISDD